MNIRDIDESRNYVFVERTLTQTVDRAELGYADEWQLLLREEDGAGKVIQEQELVYYIAGQDDPTEEFLAEYQNIVEQYRAKYPRIPVKQETVHHRKGIHYDQNRKWS
jgi:hypothetical protein